MINSLQYDVTIIGGGLAGLALSIQLAKQNYKVALFEKEQYPFHKVCGEFISLESWDFIETLGLNLSKLHLPVIKKLMVTSPNGNTLKHNLPMGGFGISRFTIDNELKKIAQSAGVFVYDNTKVTDVSFEKEVFFVHTQKGMFSSKVCIGSFGKRSNIDIVWKRNFLKNRYNKLHNYVGIKYHIKTDFVDDTIALHNFKDGYCGISKIENDTYCLCYLTTAANLKSNNNSIRQMEENVLYQNPHLKKIFTTCTMLYNAPLAISQISFTKKTQVESHVLLCGDAAGMITPLCGNGMSIALNSSKLAAVSINNFLQNKISRDDLEKQYTQDWQQNFAKRLRAGRMIQQLFGRIWITNAFIRLMKKLPYFTSKLIRQTHGEAF